MLSKKERHELLSRYCGTINEDDAIDPRHYFYNKRKQDRKFRKAFQLCKQVAETLHMVLTDGNEPLLDGLNVVDVVPAPDSKRMLVIVSLDPAVEITSATLVDDILTALRNDLPRLRAEIARSINRRKTPTLVFEIAKPDFGRK